MSNVYSHQKKTSNVYKNKTVICLFMIFYKHYKGKKKEKRKKKNDS